MSYDEGLMWELYWKEEDLVAKLRREEEELELSCQSRQIQYEADARAKFPLGKYPPPPFRQR